MTPKADKLRHVDTNTTADLAGDKKPIPLPEGMPGNDGSDPAPESDMEPGLFRPLANTPAVRGPAADVTTGDRHADRDSHSDPLGTKADTTVHPTTETPGTTRRPPG